MANAGRFMRPKDIRGSLERRALDRGRVYVVLVALPAAFTQAVTQPMQFVG
jgi:hypothetical protein